MVTCTPYDASASAQRGIFVVQCIKGNILVYVSSVRERARSRTGSAAEKARHSECLEEGDVLL